MKDIQRILLKMFPRAPRIPPPISTPSLGRGGNRQKQEFVVAAHRGGDGERRETRQGKGEGEFPGHQRETLEKAGAQHHVAPALHRRGDGALWQTEVPRRNVQSGPGRQRSWLTGRTRPSCCRTPPWRIRKSSTPGSEQRRLRRARPARFVIPFAFRRGRLRSPASESLDSGVSRLPKTPARGRPVPPKLY